MMTSLPPGPLMCQCAKHYDFIKSPQQTSKEGPIKYVYFQKKNWDSQRFNSLPSSESKLCVKLLYCLTCHQRNQNKSKTPNWRRWTRLHAFSHFFFFSHFFYSKYWILSKSEKKLIIFLDKEINSGWKNIIHGQFLEKGKEHLQEELD